MTVLRIYAAALEALPTVTALDRVLPAAWLRAWEGKHPNRTQERVVRASLGGLWLLASSGAEGTLAYTQNGRPYLTETDLDFSITHTKDHVFCAVLTDANGERIGLDAEPLDRAEAWNFASLAKRWFSPSEREAFEKEPTAEHFLSIWTRKEAAVKQAGSGLSALAETDTVMLQRSGKLAFFTYRVQNNLLTLAAPPHLAPPILCNI